MEPLSVILAALAVGGTALQPIADQAIKDAYAGFRTLLIQRFGSKSPKLDSTVRDYESDPETYERPVTKVLRDAAVDKDQNIVDTAIELLRRAESAQPGVTGGLVGQINAQGGRVIVVGQNVDTINM